MSFFFNKNLGPKALTIPRRRGNNKRQLAKQNAGANKIPLDDESDRTNYESLYSDLTLNKLLDFAARLGNGKTERAVLLRLIAEKSVAELEGKSKAAGAKQEGPWDAYKISDEQWEERPPKASSKSHVRFAFNARKNNFKALQDAKKTPGLNLNVTNPKKAICFKRNKDKEILQLKPKSKKFMVLKRNKPTIKPTKQTNFDTPKSIKKVNKTNKRQAIVFNRRKKTKRTNSETFDTKNCKSSKEEIDLLFKLFKSTKNQRLISMADRQDRPDGYFEYIDKIHSEFKKLKKSKQQVLHRKHEECLEFLYQIQRPKYFL